MKQQLQKFKNQLSKLTIKQISIITLCFVVLIGGIYFIQSTFSSPTSIITKSIVIDNIKISDITFESKDGVSTYEANVTGEEFVNYIEITLKSEDKDIVTLIGYVGNTLTSEGIKINASTDADTSNITSVEYKVIK